MEKVRVLAVSCKAKDLMEELQKQVEKLSAGGNK